MKVQRRCVDELSWCEQQWRKLFGGERTESFSDDTRARRWALIEVSSRHRGVRELVPCLRRRAPILDRARRGFGHRFRARSCPVCRAVVREDIEHDRPLCIDAVMAQ